MSNITGYAFVVAPPSAGLSPTSLEFGQQPVNTTSPAQTVGLDGLIGKAAPAEKERLKMLKGRAAIANAKLAYRLFRQKFAGPRWEALARQGARYVLKNYLGTAAKTMPRLIQRGISLHTLPHTKAMHLLQSGVPILQSLDIVSETVNNRVIGKAVMDVQASVKEGESIARPLEKHSVFPPMVVQMLGVGEETGAIDTMLEKVAQFYDNEVKATVDALTSLIEPVMIAVIGGAVGAAVIALYLPMFNIINLIK